MKLSKEQREGVLKMLGWIEGFEEIYLGRDRVSPKDFIKDQLLKILLLDEYDRRDRELLNDLRTAYIVNLKVG